MASGDISADGSRQRSLRYVACVSYPRSGHHVTQRVLQDYFGPRFRYCEFHRAAAGECCRSFPCSNPAVVMSKNHDFGLLGLLGRGVRPRATVRHLVLIRRFLDAAASEYEMTRRAEPTLADTREAWLRFARGRVRYYRRFVTKWFLDGGRHGHHAVRYEDLTSEPLAILQDIIRLFDPDRPVDIARLQDCVDNAASLATGPTAVTLVPRQGLRSRRRLEDFRWFDAADFAAIERPLWAVMTKCGYTSRFSGAGHGGVA